MDKPKFVYVTYITTTPEKLWTALTDGAITRQYWGRRENISDWKPGSSWEHRDADNAKQVDIVGKVLESTPPKRLVLSWARAADAGNQAAHSRVTFELDQFGDAVRLTVTHEDFEGRPEMFQSIARGWPAVLSSVKSLLETGKPLTMLKTREGWPPK